MNCASVDDEVSLVPRLFFGALQDAGSLSVWGCEGGARRGQLGLPLEFGEEFPGGGAQVRHRSSTKLAPSRRVSTKIGSASMGRSRLGACYDD